MQKIRFRYNVSLQCTRTRMKNMKDSFKRNCLNFQTRYTTNEVVNLI